uniref:RNA-dependent RNA polymerase n=1 Tax=Botrytis cinerea negative stranded RNA virus 9 TaxID=2746659 RepID=A0A7D4XND8_9VIRU|nr:RNA-dependent RNA polymerase [Botrytis cinerea negative stranded RNA virus 9]
MNRAWNNLHSDNGVDPLIIHTLLEALANFSKKKLTNHMLNNFYKLEGLDDRLNKYINERYKFVKSENVTNSVDFRKNFQGDYFFIRKDLTAVYPCSYCYITFDNYRMLVVNDTPLVDDRFKYINDMLEIVNVESSLENKIFTEYVKAWVTSNEQDERQRRIKYNNEVVKEECERRFVKQVPGDGFCGVHAVKIILKENNIDIEFDDLYHIFTEMEVGRKDWFNVETLHSVCNFFGLNLICFHQVENRIIIGKIDIKSKYDIILCDGFHYTPLVIEETSKIDDVAQYKDNNSFEELKELDVDADEIDYSDIQEDTDIKSEEVVVSNPPKAESDKDNEIEDFQVFEINRIDKLKLKGLKDIEINDDDDLLHSVNCLVLDNEKIVNFEDIERNLKEVDRSNLEQVYNSLSMFLEQLDLNLVILSKSLIIISGHWSEEVHNCILRFEDNRFIPTIKIFSDFETYDAKKRTLITDIESFNDGPKSLCDCGISTKEDCDVCKFIYCENCEKWLNELDYCEHILQQNNEDKDEQQIDEIPDDDDLIDFKQDETELLHDNINCICKTHIYSSGEKVIESIDLACNYKNYLYSIDINLNNYKCFCEMISSLGYFLFNNKNEYYGSNDNEFKARYLYCLDSFLKLRHDIVNATLMLEFYNSSNLKTDKEFSEVFDFMSSKKTPDNIFVKDNNVIIIETQVSNNLDKTVFQKGTTNEDSKYKTEIAELIMHKYNVTYKILFLNSKDYMNNMHSSVKILDGFDGLEKKNIYEILLNNLREFMPTMDFNDDIIHLVVGNNNVGDFNDNITKIAFKFLEELKSEGLSVSKKRPNTVVSVNSSFLKMLKIHKKQLIDRLDSRLFDKVILIQRGNRINVVKDKDNGVSNKILLDCLINERYLTLFNFSYVQQGKSDNMTVVTNLRPFEFYEESRVNNRINFISQHKLKEVFKESVHDLSLFRSLQKNRIIYEMNLEDFPRLIFDRNNSQKMMVNKICDKDSFKSFQDILQRSDKLKDMSIQEYHYKQFTTMPLVKESALVPTTDTSFSGNINPSLYDSILRQADPTMKKLLTLWDNRLMKQKPKIELPSGLQNQIKENRENIRFYLLKNHDVEDVYKKEEYIEFMKKQKAISNEIRIFNQRNGSSKSEQNVLVIKNLNDLNEVTSNTWRDKSKGSITRGVNVKDYNQASNLVNQTTNLFLQKTKIREIRHLDGIMDLGVDDISMTKLKESMMQFHKTAFDEYKQTSLCYMAEFVSSLCYNLLYMSQTTYRSNMFQFSNLNNENTLLIVRGGTNIHKNKASRQFRLVYPIPDVFKNYKEILGSSYSFINHNQSTYIITPWSVLNETVLTDNMFFNYKICSLFCNYYTRKTAEVSSDMRSAMMPVLLSFNNRRSTEANLGNIRYPLVNVLGTHSSLPDLAEDMSYIAKDALQLYIRECFKENFISYTEEVEKFIDEGFKGSITNPINKYQKITCQTDFIYVIYCTYSMTKAPYNQQVEQSINMSSVMKIHKDYDSKMNMAKDFKSVIRELKAINPDEIYSNEFYFDPQHSFDIGKYANNYLKAKNLVPSISNEWAKIMSTSWTDIITEAGMRSDKLEKGVDSFFGRKGYEVVMQELLKDIENEKVVDRIKEIMSMEISELKKSQLIRDLNKSNLDKINEFSDYLLMFHEVDKVQWKGGRQIYVMTMKTKLLLQPLEKLMAFLCKKVENELISIPSSKRLSRIHRELFPKQNLTHASESLYFTLDCSKWGPKAMFLKYMYMILGMSEILPEGVIVLMLYVTKIYFEKEVLVSKGAWKIFKNNKKNECFLSYFSEVESLDTAKFNMPYSFVMGIFNYMSSFMHAINQLKTCEEICNNVLTNMGVQISFDMKAHSDDSAGRLQIEILKDEKLTRRVIDYALIYYENSLRSVNHLLSVKKSLVSKNYLELLSILYLKRRLLSLTPKFFSNMSFKPTLEGYAADISQGYGKAIELISMGGVFSEAFFNMRCYSSMVNRFYHIEESSVRPVSAFGGLFSHPVLVVLSGGMSDNIRLFKHDEKNWFFYNSAVHMMSDGKYDFIKNSGFTPINPLYNKPSIKMHSDKICSLYGDLVNNEMLKNIKLNNSSLYPVFYNQLLKSLEFRASISYTSNTRRVIRCMISSTAVCIRTGLGLFRIKEIIALIESLKLTTNTGIDTKIFNLMQEKMKNSYNKVNIIMSAALGEGTAVYDYLSNNLAEEITVNLSNHTCKPCKIEMNLRNHLFDIKGNLELTYFSDQPNYYLSGSNVNLTSNKIAIKNSIKKYMRMTDEEISRIDFKSFIQYSRFLNKINVVDLNFYSYTSTKVRSIKNYMDIMVLIQDNSCYLKQLSKIYSDYKTTNIKKSFRGLLTIKQIEELTFAKELITLRYTLEDTELESVYHKKTKLTIKDFYNNFIKHNDKKYNRYISTDLKLLNMKENGEILEIDTVLPFCFTWVKEQHKAGDNWVGSGILLFKIRGNELMLNIEYGTITIATVYLSDEELTLEDWDNVLATCEMLDLSLRFNNKAEFTNSSQFLGFNKDDLDNLICDNLQAVDTILFPVLYTFNNLGFPNRSNVTYVKAGIYEVSGKKIETVLSLLNLNIKNMANNFYTDDDDIKDLMVNNLINVDAEIDIKKSDVINQFEKTEIFNCYVYNELNTTNYKLKNALKKYCIKNHLSYKPIEDLTITQLVNYGVNPSKIPDDIMDLYLEKLLSSNRSFDYSSFLNEVSDYIKNNKDWDSFLSKWLMGKEHQAIAVSRRNLMEVLENPLNFVRTYKSYAESMESVITDTMKELFKNDTAFFNFLNNKPILWDNSKLNDYLMKTKIDIKFSSRRSSNINKMFLFFKHIFSNSYVFKKFESGINEDVILSKIPLNPDLHEEWCRLYIILCSMDENSERYLTKKELLRETIESDLRIKDVTFKNLDIMPSHFSLVKGYKGKKYELIATDSTEILKKESFPNYITRRPLNIQASIEEGLDFEDMQYEFQMEERDDWADIVESNLKVLKFKSNYEAKFKYDNEDKCHKLSLPSASVYGIWSLDNIFEACLIASSSYPLDFKYYKQRNLVKVYHNLYNKSVSDSYIFLVYPPNDFDLKNLGLEEVSNNRYFEISDKRFDPLNYIATEDGFKYYYEMENIYEDFEGIALFNSKINVTVEEDKQIYEFTDINSLPQFYENFDIHNEYNEETVYKLKKYDLDLQKINVIKITDVENIGIFLLTSHCMNKTTNKLATNIAISLRSMQMNIDKNIVKRKNKLEFSNADFEEYKPIKKQTILNKELESVFGVSFANDILNASVKLSVSSSNMFLNLFDKIQDQISETSENYISKLSLLDYLMEIIENCNKIPEDDNDEEQAVKTLQETYKYIFEKFEVKIFKRKQRRVYTDKSESLHTKNLFKKD